MTIGPAGLICRYRYSDLELVTYITSGPVSVSTTTMGLFVADMAVMIVDTIRWSASALSCSYLIPTWIGSIINLDISVFVFVVYSRKSFFVNLSCVCLSIQVKQKITSGCHALHVVIVPLLLKECCWHDHPIWWLHDDHHFHIYARHTSRYIPSLNHGTMWIKCLPSMTNWASGKGSARIVTWDLRIVQSTHVFPFPGMPLSNSERITYQVHIWDTVCYIELL